MPVGLTPEQRLAAAILIAAFRDMSASSRSISESDLGKPTEGEVDAAISFLTESYGAKARWRNTLCSFLDIDGDQLAARVRMMLDGELDIPRTHIQHDFGIARARWRHLKYPPGRP